MKRLLTLGLVAAVVCMAWAPASFAGITGSRHDMASTGNPYTASLGAFADYGACSACHVPHGAQGARLFPNTPVGTAGGFFGPLCMTCHDATAGVNDPNVYINNTVMNSSHGLSKLALVTANDTDNTVAAAPLPYVVADANGSADNIECLSCHDVHNTQDDFRPFLQITLDDLCEACHSNRVNNATTTTGQANAFGAGSTHPAGPVFNDDVSGMAAAGSDSPFVTTPALWGTELVQNPDTGANGSTWTDTAWDSGMQLTGQGAAGAAGAGVDCISCHNVHWDEDDVGAEITSAYLGIVSHDIGTAGENNDFCEYCHQGSNAGSGGSYFWNPGSTAFSHPNDDVGSAATFTANPVLNASFNPTTSPQVGTAASGLVCTSCHGIHPQNAASETEANTPILLNHNQARALDICTECHALGDMGFNHHPTGGYATAGNTAGGVTCMGGDTEGYTTCHGAGGGANGAAAHNRTSALGVPDPGTWGVNGAGYMCVTCHTYNPSTYTTATPYTAGGLASHFVGDALPATQFVNGRTTDPGTGAIRFAGDSSTWNETGLTSLFQDGTATGSVLICESCHRLAEGNTVGGDGNTALLVELSGALTSSVAAPGAQDATDYTGQPYLCTGCHLVPGGTHPLADAGGSTAYTIVGPQGQTYTTADNMNCESCHSPHDADTVTGSYILDGGSTGTGTTGMEIEPTIDYTQFCAICHGAFD